MATKCKKTHKFSFFSYKSKTKILSVSGFDSVPTFNEDGTLNGKRTFQNWNRLNITGIDGDILQIKHHVVKIYKPGKLIINEIEITTKGVPLANRFHHVQR